MAEQPKYFDIEDYQTGKRYRVEAYVEDATYDEAVKYISELPEKELAQYEYNDTSAVQSPGTVPTKQTETPAPVEQIPSINNTLNAFDVQSGTTKRVTREIANNPKVTSLAESLWAQGVRDPEVYSKNLSAVAGKPVTITAEDLAVVRKRDAYYKAKGVKAPGLFTYTEPTGEKDPERPDTILGVAGQAAARSTANIYNSGVGALALGADLVGADETSDSLLEDYIENNAKIAYHYGRPVRTDEVEDLESAAMFAADVFGELAPQLVGSFGLGYLGKEAATYSIKKGAQELIEAKVQQGVAREVAEQQVLNSLKKRAAIGAAAGVSSNSIVQETGSTFGTTYEQTGEKAPLLSIAAGVASGSLDTLLPLTVLNKLGGGRLINEFKRNFLARAAKEGGKGFALEGGTEALQEFITTLPKSVITGESPFSKETFDQMFEAFWRGGFGGGGVNVAVEGVNSLRTEAPQPVGGGIQFTPTVEPGAIVAPTSRKYVNRQEGRTTKKYKQELAQSTGQVVDVVNTITENWTNKPDVTVHDNFEDVEGVSNTALGVYTEDGRVLLNTEAILEKAKKRDVSPEALTESVLFHEALGHNGLTQLFQEDLDAFLGDVLSNARPELRAKVEEWIEKRPAAYQDNPKTGKRDKNWQEIRALEEVMAEVSEKEGILPRKKFDEFLNLVKDFARQMGLDLKYSSREIRAYLAVAQNKVINGKATEIGGPGTIKNQEDERTPDTYSAGFKRPKQDERSKPEARKQFWKNKENPNWNPNDPNGLPDTNKYMNDGDESGKRTVIVVHGGSDFDQIDLAYSGRGEPGNIRPLGKGLYGFVVETKNPEQIRTAVEYARHYATKYGRGDKALHLFEVNVDGSKTSFNGQIIEGLKGEILPYEQRDQLDLRFEKLPGGLIEASILNSNKAKRIGKIGLDQSDEDLIKMIGKSTNNRYMDDGDAIDPDNLTGEDLVNSKDALAFLEAATKGYKKQTLSFDNIEQDAIERGVPPSAVTRWVGTDPAELTRRIIMYDIAMEKLNTRLDKISAKIRTEGITEKSQMEYLTTLATIGELGPKIFQEQSELGRAFGAIRRSTFTAKKAVNMQELLRQYDLEALADPETFYKLMAQIDGEKAKAAAKKTGNKLLSAFNLPRAIMSSLDLSAPLRQGVVFIGQGNFWKSFFKMFTYLGPSGEANYAQLMREITKHENYSLMGKARLSFSDLDGNLSSREEDFQSDIARKIPGVRMSERAYAGFLNKLRADMFNKYVEQYNKAGIELDDNMLLGLGRFINSATGRAELPGGLQSMAPQLNAVFFSPRLMQSRFNMLNPYFYYKLPAPVRKEAVKNMMAFGGIAILTLGIAAMMGAEVEEDPRSSDFGKIKVGNTRYDIGGGFNQYLVLGARTVSWLAGIEAVKTSSGELKELGPDQGETTYGETVLKFFRSKLSPNAAIVVNTAMEENVIGEPYTVGSALSSMLPLHIQSVMDAAKEYDPVTAAAVTAPGFFGVGVNTYVPYAIDKEQKLDASESITLDGEKFELSKEQREFFKQTRNNYFQTFVKEYTLETGKSWDQLSDDEKEEIIKDAKADAQYESRLDIIEELGL